MSKESNAEMTRHGKASGRPPAGKLFALLLAPLLLYVLIVAGLLLADFTYMNWGKFVGNLTSPAILFALRLSLITSTITVLLSLLVAVPGGYVLSRGRFPGITLIDTVVDIPIVLPPLVVGLSLLLLFTRPFSRGVGEWFVFQPAGVVAAQFVVACAFGIRTMKATFDGIDPRYESVARTLGFGPWRAFFRGTLPLARNGMVAAAVVVWARAIGEFGPILVLCGATHFRTEVMPTSIYLEWSVGNLDGALAVSLLMIVSAVAVLLVLKKAGGKAYIV